MSNWRDLFQAALLKTDPLDLEQRVTAAQHAIDERMRELIQENIRASQEEREIREAVQTLKVLRREIEENERRTADELMAVMKYRPPTRKREESERKEGSGC